MLGYYIVGVNLFQLELWKAASRLLRVFSFCLFLFTKTKNVARFQILTW